jgi:hypothetical protein
MSNNTERELQLIVRAWEDKEFKQELLNNPKGVITRETGFKYPDEVEVRVLAESSNIRYLVLPASDLSHEKRQEAINQLREGQSGEFSHIKIRSIEDTDFRKNLISQPKDVIGHTIGIRIPEETDIRVVEEEKNIRYLILPWHPELAEDEKLSEEALEAVAGGACWFTSVVIH